MDFLDPRKQQEHIVRLIVGYVLVGIAILLTVRLLLYIATGYSYDNGKIIQNGLIFVSSHPGGSSIYLNDKLNGTTNTRMSLPAGSYKMVIQRRDYRNWQREITVEGDSVERFDYPFLIPSDLVTKTTKSLTAAPILSSQSPSRRWVLLETSVSGNFTLVDLNNPKKVVTKDIAIPTSTFTPAATDAHQTLKVVAWSDDNRHVLLQRTYDNTYEYILFDTKTPSLSQNLTSVLHVTPPTQVTLQNNQYDHYFVYNPTDKSLGTANLNASAVAPLLRNVLSFKSYGNNVILYASSQKTESGQTPVFLYQNNHNYLIRDVPVSSLYLLDLTQYSGSWYIVAGSSADNRVYVYKNPLDVLATVTQDILVPVAVLKVSHPTYEDFSASAQFIMAENGTNFAVYDIQYDDNYTYKTAQPLDKPQLHATWMDGDRLDYISGGKLVEFDYDDTNTNTLMTANPNYIADFDPGYNFVYAVAAAPKTGAAPASYQLTNTALLAPRDQ